MMSEKDNLQEADGINEKTAEDKTEKIALADPSEELIEAEEHPMADSEVAHEDKVSEAEMTEADKEVVESITEVPEARQEALDEEAETSENDTDKKTDGPASDYIEQKDYRSMDMEALVGELVELLKHDKVHVLKQHVEGIKASFNKQFSKLLETQKQQFLAEGGNSIDFRFDYPLKARFNALIKDYRERRQAYYQNLEKTLNTNLENRLEIIEEIKKLLNAEEDINTTYKHFKALQERWRNAGPIPRDRYNNVWNNYHHHVENFYDFLHLNRDLRELDFKHNLEQKLKIIERAEELAEDDDSNRAFRELQVLHKMWKEELGPVAKDHREEIWERFKKATKQIHEKRQVYFKELDKAYVQNLEKKHEIINKIKEIAEDTLDNHAAWQKKDQDCRSPQAGIL